MVEARVKHGPALEGDGRGLGHGEGRSGRGLPQAAAFWGDSFTAPWGLFPSFQPFHHPARECQRRGPVGWFLDAGLVGPCGRSGRSRPLPGWVVGQILLLWAIAELVPGPWCPPQRVTCSASDRCPDDGAAPFPRSHPGFLQPPVSAPNGMPWPGRHPDHPSAATCRWWLTGCGHVLAGQGAVRIG